MYKSVNGTTAVAFQVPMNALSRRIGLRAGLLLGHAFYLVGFLGFALPATTPLFPFLSMFVFTLGEVLCVLNVGAVPIAASGTSDRGRYLGAAQLAHAGGGLGPMMGGVLLAVLGPQEAWFAVAGVVVFAALLHVESLRALGRTVLLPGPEIAGGVAPPLPRALALSQHQSTLSQESIP